MSYMGSGLIGSACWAMKCPETAPSQPLPKIFQGLFNGQCLKPTNLSSAAGSRSRHSGEKDPEPFDTLLLSLEMNSVG